MKRFFAVAILSATLLSAQAQLFSQESFGGAVLGGIIGGVIGHNSGRHTAEGAAIGAGAGLLLGAIAHDARRESYYTQPAVVATPGYYSYGYAYEPRPNYAVAGTVLGGIAGGVMGHNSGRRTAEGIAIGAGAGLLLGAIAEENARSRVQYIQPGPAYVVAQSPTQVQVPVPAVATASPAPPAAGGLAQSFSAPSVMSASGANALFGR